MRWPLRLVRLAAIEKSEVVSKLDQAMPGKAQ